MLPTVTPATVKTTGIVPAPPVATVETAINETHAENVSANITLPFPLLVRALLLNVEAVPKPYPIQPRALEAVANFSTSVKTPRRLERKDDIFPTPDNNPFLFALK